MVLDALTVVTIVVFVTYKTVLSFNFLGSKIN